MTTATTVGETQTFNAYTQQDEAGRLLSGYTRMIWLPHTTGTGANVLRNVLPSDSSEMGRLANRLYQAGIIESIDAIRESVLQSGPSVGQTDLPQEVQAALQGKQNRGSEISIDEINVERLRSASACFARTFGVRDR